MTIRLKLETSKPTSENETFERAKGIGVIRAAIFIVANVAGSGVLALPKAASDAGGWLGIGIIVLISINAGFAATHLSLCWVLVEKYYPELRERVRNPYPTIGEKAFGRWAKNLVIVVMQIELLGAGTVFFLLSSQIISSYMEPYTPNMSSCTWLLVIAAILCPFMWLGSPKDFWGFGVIAMGTTLIACIVAVTQSIIDSTTLPKPDTSLKLTAKSFFLGFGVIVFAFGGSSAFPTIQNDMRIRDDFKKSVGLAFSVLLLMYLPVTIAGFAVYGHDVSSSILDSLSEGIPVTVAELLIAGHLITAIILLTNPATQFLEILFKVPPKFGWKRCAVRTGALLLMVFVGETIQDFGQVLSLVGGSTTTLSNLVFPPLFYLKLKHMHERDSPVHPARKAYLIIIAAIGIIGGIAATYSAFLDIFSAETFQKPCYVP